MMSSHQNIPSRAKQIRFARTLGFLVLLCGLLIGTAWAGVGGQGFWGTGQFPSASLMPQGDLAIFGGKPSSGGKYSWGFAASPLHWLELGASFNDFSKGDLGIKGQLPRLDPLQPILSIGAYGLADSARSFENIYFVGGYEFRGTGSFIGFDFGAVVHRHEQINDSLRKSAVASFISAEFELSSLGMMMEISRERGAWGFGPSVWWKPLEQLRMGGGANYSTAHWKQAPTGWGQISIQMPLQRMEDTIHNPLDTNELRISNHPFLWIDIDPVFDHSYTAGSSQYRALWDVQAVAQFGFEGLYWVNGLDLTMVNSRDRDRLAPRAPWDRSYLLFSKETLHGKSIRFREPIVAMGKLQKGTWGLGIWQDFHFGHWNASRITLGSTFGEIQGFQAVLRQPIHGPLPWFLRWTQFSLEGGLYPDQELRAFFNWEQGSERNHLNLSGGYDIQAQTVLARAELQFNFSGPFTTRKGDVQFSALGHVKHRFEATVANPSAFTFTPVYEGNNGGELVGIPWPPRVWRGDSLRKIPVQSCDALHNDWSMVQNMPACAGLDYDLDGIPNRVDKCPTEAEDIDNFQDSDGCPDKDNDGDGILDFRDACPNQAEDKDNFEDTDGCPDLDNDQDSVPDVSDKCPLQKEDWDGFQDADGCPDPDNDNDGVPDSKDLCPMEPGSSAVGTARPGCKEQGDSDGIPLELDACPDQSEDFDGFEDLDGCPDLDNDHDGIPDNVDKCPNQPETMNGKLDEDGCPD